MIKMVYLLVRKDGMTHDEFADYWMEEHVPIAKEMPNLRKYSTSLPTDPEKSEYDGIAELYFDDMADLGEGFESEAGEKVQEDSAEFSKPDENEMLIVEETVQLGE